jgi:alkyl hydroperoxide reductase subunit F
MLDLIIIGAGPAGITAAVYAARKNMDFLVISKDIGGQTAWSGDIENYTGYQFVTGPELVAKFEEHMNTYKVPMKEGEEVLELSKEGEAFKVRTGKASYEARTVIIASGKRSRELGVPGEKEFKNKGLTYCATCDGPLFAGKDVAVIGGGNSALDASIQMMKIARKTYVINIMDHFTGDAIMAEKVSTDSNVEVFHNAKVAAIAGDKFVSSITMSREGKARILPVSGVFVEIGLIPNSAFLKGVAMNPAGEIITDARNRTNIPGLFAAGDVTDVPEKQIIIAAGEGSKALLGAFRYLSSRK